MFVRAAFRIPGGDIVWSANRTDRGGWFGAAARGCGLRGIGVPPMPEV